MKKQNIIIIVIFIIVIAVYFFITNYMNKETEEYAQVIVPTEEPIVTISDDDKEFYTVYVSGEVYRADCYVVPSTWTLGMLFDLAGIKASGDISGFNLAASLVDGKEYHIPKEYIYEDLTDKLININHASKEELMDLPGIGESIALKIISYRTQTPFEKIEDIKNVSGIGDKVYEKIKDYITV